MTMTFVTVGLFVISFAFGVFHGTLDKVSAAAMSGAQSALELCFSMAAIAAAGVPVFAWKGETLTEYWDCTWAVLCGSSCAASSRRRGVMRKRSPR